MTAATVAERYVISARLVAASDLAVGGDPGMDVDREIVRDGARVPIIPGTTLAGVLRAALGARLDEDERHVVTELFGGTTEHESQSRMIIDDAVLLPTDGPEVAVRDGVRIDRRTGTAAGGFKYDFEVIPAGRSFAFHAELTFREADDHAARMRMRGALALLLALLSNGEIGVGSRTRRGLGALRAEASTLQRYDYSGLSGVRAWLAGDVPPVTTLPDDAEVTKWLEAHRAPKADTAVIEAAFRLAGPMLIRTAPAPSDMNAPDVQQARSVNGPLLYGTSVAGALRSRADRIVRTLRRAEGERAADESPLVSDLFGPVGGAGVVPRAGRVRVAESVMKGTADAVQSRVRVDRITGAVATGALFNEMPAWPRAENDDEPHLSLVIEIDRPSDAEIGLVLHLVKDLWTRDLTIGGGAGVGRGVLAGRSAALRAAGATVRWHEAGGRLAFDEGSPSELERYSGALLVALGEGMPE